MTLCVAAAVRALALPPWRFSRRQYDVIS